MNKLLLYWNTIVLLCTTSLWTKSNFLNAQTYQTICRGQTAQLNTSKASYNYSWSPSYNLNSSTIRNPIASPITTTTYNVTCATPKGSNLIWDGNFNYGTAGFWSAYTIGNGGQWGQLSSEGTYGIQSNASAAHSGFHSCSGHNGGNFMVVNGATIANQAVWCKTVTVLPSTNYEFSAWLASVHPSNPASLRFEVNGVPIGNLNASSSTCQWNQFQAIWNSGTNTSVQICITNQNTNQGGNDFGLDDIEFRPICSLNEWIHVTVIDPQINVIGNRYICEGNSTTLTGTGTGSSYYWSNGVNGQSNTVSPTSTAYYTVTSVDQYGCSANTGVYVYVNPRSTTPSLASIPGSICPNTNVTLTVGGGTASSGSSIRWYTGPNGSGTWLNSGSTCTLTPTDGQKIYVRREGGCNTTADDSITINLKHYIYALNGATTNTYCTDNNGWHHFYQGNEILLSAQGDLTGAPVGFPQITISDTGSYYQQNQGPLAPGACVHGLSSGEERFEMERSWNVDFGGGALNPPYKVRFYYEPSERTAIENAATTHMTTYPACGYSYKYANPLGFYWFKNTGSDYIAPDYDGIHLASIGGITSNGINYGELSGITSFSGGGGGVSLVPNAMLSTEWLYFKGTTNNRVNSLNWATKSEQNTLQFDVQRSRDGLSFETIGTVAAIGNSASINDYLFDDMNPFNGTNYYRLELLHANGNVTYSNTILLTIVNDDLGYNFYPNPTDNVVYYQYEALEIENLHIEILDVLGKEIRSEEAKNKLGINNIPIDLGVLPRGAYIVRVNNGLKVHTAKVILK